MQHGFPRNPDSSVVWESEAQKWGSQQWKQRKVVSDIAINYCSLANDTLQSHEHELENSIQVS